MRWSKAAAGAALASLALVTAACGGTGPAATSADDKPVGTATLWVRDNQKGFIKLLTDAYNRTHEGEVEVTVVPAGNFVQKFGTAVASGSGPDIASIDLVYLPYFASKGVLEDITEVEAELPFRDELSPAHRRLARYEGRTYALPFTAEASVMFYNKDLFRKAGLDPEDPPASYAEMLEAARAIGGLGPDTYGFTFAGSCGGCNVFEFAPHVWASGGEILSKDGRTAMLDSPEVGEALEFYRQLRREGLIPPAAKTDAGTAQAAAFQAGKVGMTNLGAFFVPTLVKDGKVDFGVAPIPGRDGGSASFAGGDEIAVTKTARNKAVAYDFVRWAVSEEAQTILAKEGIIPVRTDVAEEVYAPLDPRYEVFAEAMATGRTPYSTVENAVFNDNNGPWARMVNQGVYGPSVQAAQTAAQRAAQQIIDRN